jgi:hypothetical protein
MAQAGLRRVEVTPIIRGRGSRLRISSLLLTPCYGVTSVCPIGWWLGGTRSRFALFFAPGSRMALRGPPGG